MIIDEVTYALPIDNYIQNESIKTLIVIGHTSNHDMRHVTGWLHRYNGKYKKTASFTIDINGIVYKHFEPKYQARYFNNLELDNKTIVILLENDGWLYKDIVKNEFITWIGDIYKQSGEIVEKKWRNHAYWSPYSDKQIDSANELVKMLCKEFFIPMTAISHNTKIDNLLENNGIIYKSNLNKHYTDLSPAWNFLEFKEKIETMKENINEHDMTKKMMDIMRGGFKTTLNEFKDVPSLGTTQPQQQPKKLEPGDDSPEPQKDGDTLSPKQGDAVFTDELKKLRDTVDPEVTITNFKIYPSDKNVVIEGVFQQRESENSGIHFKMSLRAGKIETSMVDIDLNDDTSTLLAHLKGYYENWKNEWATKVVDEYPPKHN